MSKIIKINKTENKNKKYVSLYIHIPFYITNIQKTNNKNMQEKQTILKTPTDQKLKAEYYLALVFEINKYKEKLQNHTVNSIFIGGSKELLDENANKIKETDVIKPYIYKENEFKSDVNNNNKADAYDYVKNVINYVKQSFNVAENAEITHEIVYDKVNQTTAKNLYLGGVNRISVVDNPYNSLWFGNTKQKLKNLKNSFNILKNSGFKNINLDIEIGFPNQKINSIKNVISVAKECRIPHISIYEFVAEDYKNIIKEQELLKTSDNKTQKLFNKAINLLFKNNYNRYEISNFSLPNYECKHSLNLWSMQEFVGLGAGAYSFFNNTRYNNISIENGYIHKTYLKGEVSENIENLTEQMLFEEEVMLGLQTVKGIDLLNLYKKYNINLLENKQTEIENLINLGLVVVKNNRLYLTNKGFNFINKIVLELIY